MDRTEAIAREAWDAARDLILGGEHELVVLDEITYPINWGWIDEREVTETIRDRPLQVNIVATGRDAPETLRAVADTVTEMASVKHAFDDGIGAMRGIEY
jgi:cob(I)alamin adenosyltransferase